MGAEADKPEVRTVAHLHGGRVPAVSDGYPENWVCAGQNGGASLPEYTGCDAAVLSRSRDGDHAVEYLRWLFGLFVIRDAAEDALGLPRGEYEIPLVLFDRFLKPDGGLFYPASQWPKAPWVPEFFGNSVLVNGKLLPFLEVEPRQEASAVRTRQLTLEEYDNVLAEPMTHLLNGKRWQDPVTENPVLDTTEIWSLVNLTDDAHPIHLHLVRFQILDRRAFDVTEYLVHKRIRYVGEAFPPDANEAGWKDTVKATPGAVTRIIIKFEGYAGRYVWHCHILEHEDNEMMRPYGVIKS